MAWPEYRYPRNREGHHSVFLEKLKFQSGLPAQKAAVQPALEKPEMQDLFYSY